MRFDTASLHADAVYRLLSSSVVPRPIAWLTTLNANSSVNLAPFSFFNAVSSEPPMIAVSIEDREPGVEKDTLANIKRTPCFVCHVVTEDLLEATVISAIEFPSNVSEVEVTNLNLVDSQHIPVPRLREAKVSMECQLETLLRVGTSATLVIAKILCFHLQDELYKNRRVDSAGLQAVGRLSGSDYAKTREIVSIPSSSYEAWVKNQKKK